ncbi:MAG: EAL domain-containing protein [Stagnimonas sp.]|nr:EAL domain-containing protein [Stagnimonas sp.]
MTTTHDQSAPSVMTPHRILIVEDERVVALNLQQRLIKLGYEVVGRAASGAQALQLAEDGKPDIVLMDIHIEGDIDGIETAALLLARYKLQVIYLTAYSEDTTLQRAKATQPYGYLLKPFSERELHATLQVALERRSSDIALAASEERARLALEAASMGSWELLPSTAELRTFGLASELLGDGSGSGAMDLEALLTHVHQDDRPVVRLAVTQAIQGGAPCCIEFRQLRANRPARWIRIVARVFAPPGAAAPRLIGVAQDITERRTTETHLREAATIFEETRDGLFILDQDYKLTSANPALARMTGIDIADWIGKELSFLMPPALSEQVHDNLWAQLKREGCWQGELLLTSPAGLQFPARLSLNVVRDSAIDWTQAVGILSDVSELRSVQVKLQQLAHYDQLTGLANRLLMQDRLAQAIYRGRRYGLRVAVLFLDLDQFKRINDSFGHATGDLVLREAANRIKGNIRNDDTAARHGGDEFVVIVENFAAPSDVMTLAEKIRAALAQPMQIGEQVFHISSSIGIALFPDNGSDAEQLLQGADTAMYEAKAKGRNQFMLYDRAMTAKVANDLARDARLRRALSGGELCLHYQPVVDTSTGQCRAVEALVRWQHPTLGLLDADEIIPAAEASGLIIELGRWVLREACRQAALWRDAGYRDLRVAFNVSSAQFRDGTLAAEVAATLQEFALNPAQLEMEITESCLQTESIAIETLTQIRALGVSIAIDDFGTGFSCLSSLKQLPLDRLKIDRSFVHELPHDAHSSALAETILAIAGRMKLQVTAEGVETHEQMDYLRSRGCKSQQGWLFGRTVEAAKIPPLLAGPWPLDPVWNQGR